MKTESKSEGSGCAGDLALSGAVLRFLNLVAQVGERRLGLTKFHECALALGVPEWMVRLRHEAAHGDMPGAEELKDGAEFALRWLVTNYWGPEAEALREVGQGELLKSDPVYATLNNMLECYGYLKIYSLWNTHTIVELRDKLPEVHEHIVSLWTALLRERKNTGGLPKNADNIKIKDALRTVLSDIEKFFRKTSSAHDRAHVGRIATKVLLSEELLLPKKESLESILEDSKDERNDAIERLESKFELPSCLWMTWRDIVECLAFNGNFVCDVLVGLFDVSVEGESHFEKSLASAWIIAISKSLVSPRCEAEVSNKKKKKKSIQDNDYFFESIASKEELEKDGRFNKFVSYCLDHPSKDLLSLLPSVGQLHFPGISTDQRRALENLVKTFAVLQDSSEDTFELQGHEVKTGENLIDAARGDNIWTLVQDVKIENSPLGLLPNQDEASLQETLVVEVEVDSREEEEPETREKTGLKFDEENKWFQVPKIDWEHFGRGSQFSCGTPGEKSAAQDSPETPAFYRNPGVKSRGYNNRRSQEEALSTRKRQRRN